MKHRGEIVEKAVRESGINITELARRLKCSRSHVYDIFNTSDVNIDTIIEIGKIIHYDFSGKIPQSASQYFDFNKSLNTISEPNETNNTVAYWREKYLTVLEEYNKLMSKYVALIEEKK